MNQINENCKTQEKKQEAMFVVVITNKAIIFVYNMIGLRRQDLD